MNDMPEVKVGQVWQEMDPRFLRLVEVLKVLKADPKRPREPTVQIKTIGFQGKFVDRRPTWTTPKRFNGKHGGFVLYKDVP